MPDDMEQELSYSNMNDGDLLRFRCRIGHAFSADSVLSAQDEQLESALWTALKALEESASLSRNLARQAAKRGQGWLSLNFEERSRDAEQRALTIRQVLRNGEPGA